MILHFILLFVVFGVLSVSSLIFKKATDLTKIDYLQCLII